ncbi:MAG: MerR family transcriptional regulator [Desulfuromonadales bacterium]|nr:MerR family transcriptional regulator [Desulfuromonadales bacterium]
MESTVSEKLYYRIGEVAELLEVRTSVIRFWEKEFSELKPKKAGTGQRLFLKSDIELLQKIKKLLYIEKMTIAGAKGRLLSDRKDKSERKAEERELLLIVKQELQAIRNSI